MDLLYSSSFWLLSHRTIVKFKETSPACLWLFLDDVGLRSARQMPAEKGEYNTHHHSFRCVCVYATSARKNSMTRARTAHAGSKQETRLTWSEKASCRGYSEVVRCSLCIISLFSLSIIKSTGHCGVAGEWFQIYCDKPAATFSMPQWKSKLKVWSFCDPILVFEWMIHI